MITRRKILKYVGLLFLVAAIGLITGCANVLTSASQKSPGFTGRIEKLLIVTQTTEKALVGHYGRMFPKIVDMLAKENVKADVLLVDKLTLNIPETIAAKTKDVAATQMLTIDLDSFSNRTIYLGTTAASQFEYDVVLHLRDAVSQKALWSGKIHVVQDYSIMAMDSNMQEIAARVVAMMKADKLIWQGL